MSKSQSPYKRRLIHSTFPLYIYIDIETTYEYRKFYIIFVRYFFISNLRTMSL